MIRCAECDEFHLVRSSYPLDTMFQLLSTPVCPNKMIRSSKSDKDNSVKFRSRPKLVEKKAAVETIQTFSHVFFQTWIPILSLYVRETSPRIR